MYYQDAVLDELNDIGISNEVLPNKTAEVWVEDGSLLLVKVF